MLHYGGVAVFVKPQPFSNLTPFGVVFSHNLDFSVFKKVFPFFDGLGVFIVAFGTHFATGVIFGPFALAFSLIVQYAFGYQCPFAEDVGGNHFACGVVFAAHPFRNALKVWGNGLEFAIGVVVYATFQFLGIAGIGLQYAVDVVLYGEQVTLLVILFDNTM